MVRSCEEEMHRCPSDLQSETTQNYVDFYILLQFIFIYVQVRILISRLDFLKYYHRYYFEEKLERILSVPLSDL